MENQTRWENRSLGQRIFIYAAAPLCVLLLAFLLFSWFKLYPFGDNTVSWCDMNQQVIPLLLDFKDILEENGSLFLNMQNAGGMNFWGVFLFFLSSPFSFLMLWIPKTEIYHAVNLMVVGKMMVCAFTASVFFHKRFRKLNEAQTVCLSLLYAFCGYSLFYYQNIVWLDMMYLLPLLLLSLLWISEKYRILPYVLALSAMMAVNFYLSYMVLLFVLIGSVLYIHFCVQPAERGKNTVLLGIGTFISGFITAPVWLPSLLQYLASARTGDLYFNLISGKFLTTLHTTLPQILCTSVILIAILACFFKGRRWEKKRIYILILFLLMLIPVLIEPINKMWHTGSYQAFPVQYGYMTVFIGLILFASLLEEEGQRPAATTSRGICVFLAVACLLVPCTAILLLRDFFKEITVYTRTLWGTDQSLSLLLVFFVVTGASYFLLLLFLRYRQITTKVFTFFLALLVCTECVFNGAVYIGSAGNSPERYRNVLDLADQIDSDSFYRVKTEKKYFDVNLIGALGYPSLSHYTSLTQKDYMYTMKKLGYSSYWMEVNSNGGTLFSDWLMGNQYVIKSVGDCDPEDVVVYQNSSYVLTKAYETVPFGVVFSSKNIDELEKIQAVTRVGVQEKIYHTLFSEQKSPFVHYLPSSMNNILSGETEAGKVYYIQKADQGAALSYSVTVSGTQQLYFDCFDETHNYLLEAVNGSFNIYVNGQQIQSDYPSQSSNGLLDLGTYTDTTVSIYAELNKDVEAYSIGVFGLDIQALKETMDAAELPTVYCSNDRFSFTVEDGASGEYLFVPIANDGGYTALVNGQKTDIYTVFDTFLAIPLQEGKNIVELSYSVPGLRLGWIFTALGLLLLGIYVWIRKQHPRWLEKLENPAYFLCVAAACIAWSAVYVFPVCVFLSR